MPRSRPSTGLIYPIFRVFLLAASLGAGAISVGCSSGESGLVLGSPLSEPQGGSAGTGGAGSSQAGAGSPLFLGGDSGGGAPDLGTAGATEASVPPWIADACTPTLGFVNRDTTAQGQLFTDAVPDPSMVFWQATHDACRVLYRSASEVKSITKISLVVEDYDGIASTAGTSLHLSTRYLKTEADRGVDLYQEIAGILHFSTSLVYQNTGSDADPAPPHWLTVGIADYVRLESGYIDRAERAKGGSYDGSSSQRTAFFLDYLATKDPNIVYELNQRLAPTAAVWSNDVFKSLLGSDVDTLWASYQATL